MSTGLGQDPGQRQAWGVARLGQPALRDKESDAQSDEDTQGRRLPGKGNNTFFSHREVGVTAGFAGSNHLLEQGSLEIRQLRERKTLKRVKTSYARGGGGVGWGSVGHRSQDVPKSGWNQSPGVASAETAWPAAGGLPGAARPRVLPGPGCCHVRCPTQRPPVSGEAPGCVVRGQGCLTASLCPARETHWQRGFRDPFHPRAGKFSPTGPRWH